jgi:hypothetical protein
MTEVNVVGLFPSAAGLLVIDYYAGTIAPLETGGVAGAAPVAAPPPPPAPFVGVVPQQATWQPGGGPLSYGIKTNVAGREGANTEWSAVLLVGCTDAGACQVAQLVAPAGPAPNVLTIPSPPIDGTLEFWAHTWTYGGLSVQSTWWQASAAGAAECHCAGQRTPVTAASIGWGAAPQAAGEGAAAPPGAAVVVAPVLILSV